MANPAKLLHDMILDWRVPQGNLPESVRADGDPSGLGFWHAHARAVGFLRDIEIALNGMEAVGEEVEHYRDVLPEFYKCVFAYSTPWSSSVNGVREPIDRRDLRLLRALAGHLDSINYVAAASGDQLLDLLESLDKTEQLIRTSEDITVEVRRYLLGLVGEARRVATELETFGDVELRSITFQLGAAVLSTADQMVPEEKRSGWIAAVKELVRKIGWKGTELMLENGVESAFDALGAGG